jgi:hypothetical protein
MEDLDFPEYKSRKSLEVFPDFKNRDTTEIYALPVWKEYLLSLTSLINSPTNLYRSSGERTPPTSTMKENTQQKNKKQTNHPKTELN